MIRHIFAIALNTFRESIRSRVLYSAMSFAILLCAAASAFGRVTIGEQWLVVETFGLFCASVFSLIFALISGSTLFAKELSRRTIFTLLARPVARYEILIGKWAGLFMTSACLVMLISAALALYIGLAFQRDTLPIFLCSYFMLTELMIVCSLLMLFSALVVTPLFIGLFSLAVFLAGRCASSILPLIVLDQQSSPALSVLEMIYLILPKFEFLAVSDRIVAGEVLAVDYYLSGFGYALGYSVITLIIASVIFNRREFN